MAFNDAADCQILNFLGCTTYNNLKERPGKFVIPTLELANWVFKSRIESGILHSPYHSFCCADIPEDPPCNLWENVL